MLRELLVFSIIVNLRCDRIWADKCKHHLNALAVRQQDFVRCSTLHAVPVQLCVGCEGFHANMTEAYNVLATEPQCSETYFDKDRINIVSTTQSILTGLWDKAYCDDCFNENKNNLTDWQLFESKSLLLHDCFSNNKNKVCTACLVPYQDINDFYKDLDKLNNGKVCYDMQDLNHSRIFVNEIFANGAWLLCHSKNPALECIASQAICNIFYEIIIVRCFENK